MRTDTLLNSGTQELTESLTLFLQAFEPLFEDFLTSLCQKYDPKINATRVKELTVALNQSLVYTYEQLPLYEAFFRSMRHDHTAIDFIVHKAILYWIEHYCIFSHAHSVPHQYFFERINYLLDTITAPLTPTITPHYLPLDYQDVMGKTSSNVFKSDLSDDVLLSPTSEIMQIFHRMVEENQKTLFCLNLYEGIPISSEATIVKVSDTTVTFHMSPLQKIAIILENQAFFVKNSYFQNYHLKADIEHIDFRANQITFNHFRYIQSMPALQREGVRVYPTKTSKIALYQEGTLYLNGILHDISNKGLSILSNEKEGLSDGENVLLEFELQDEKVSLNGKVISIISYPNSFRYCIHILANEGISQMIARYIEQREQEIIAKLHMELQKYV